MSEQRFVLNVNGDDDSCLDIIDNHKDKCYSFVNDVVSLHEAKELVALLNEQQDTIFKLQDLCGKSDGENMKLRIENKRLEKEVNLLRPTNIEQYEQIQKLQEENEKLRKELGDCEKFRYTTFKRMRDVLDE